MKRVVLFILSLIVIAASEHEENVRDASADESANRYVGYDQNELGPAYRLVYIGQNIQRPGGDSASGIYGRGHENIANYKYRFQNYNQQLGYNLGYGQNEDLGRGQQNVDHYVYGLNLGYPGVYGANANLGDKKYVIYDQGVNRGYEIQEEQPEEKIHKVINKQYHQYNRARGDKS